jgi:hypothetical protein
MQPWEAIPSFTARDPAMLKWSGLLTRLGGGRQLHFLEDFFSRFDQNMLMVDDYGYAGIDFCQDLDLMLPDDEDWDASLGRKHVISFHAVIFICFLNFIIFLVYGITNIPFVIYRSCTDTTNGDVPDTTQGCTEDRGKIDRHGQERAKRCPRSSRRGSHIVDGTSTVYTR